VTFNQQTFLPPVLAVPSAQRGSGRQQLGSGLVTHRGIIDANSLRATGVLYPQSGAGLELIFFQTPTYPAKKGTLQAYDRDASAYCDLDISAWNINLNPQSGGKVSMPAGTCQQLIGSYVQSIGWTLPQSSVWTESPIQVTPTFTGAQVRLEFNVMLGCPTKGQRVFWGIFVDGALASGVLGAEDAPEANYGIMSNGTWYWSPAAGTHRIGYGLYGPAGSQIVNSIVHGMYLTEQRA